MTDQDRAAVAGAPSGRGKSVWRRLVFWAGAVCLVALLTTVVIELLRPATYTSEAWLMISRRNRPLLLQPAQYQDPREETFIENQVEILRSKRLLEPLAAIPEIMQTPELAGERDVPAAIGQRLKIKHVGKSDMYAVSFSSVSPQHAQAVVKGVVDAYLSLHRSTEANHFASQVEALKKQGDARYREMSQLRDQVKTKAILVTGVDPFAPAQAEPPDADQELLKELQKEWVRQLVQQQLLAATIAASKQEQTSSSGTDESSSGELEANNAEYSAGEARVKGLEQKIASIRASQKQYTGESLDLEFLRSKLAAVTEVHDAIHKRILALTTEAGAAARVDLYQEATLPTAPDQRWWEIYR
jgi:hypothetical protein